MCREKNRENSTRSHIMRNRYYIRLRVEIYVYAHAGLIARTPAAIQLLCAINHIVLRQNDRVQAYLMMVPVSM